MTTRTARDELVRTIAADLVTAEVVTMWRRAGVACILLKGATFARWLYGPDESRPYVDADLLVGPDNFATAEAVLRSRGFVDSFAGATDAERGRHGSPWVRDEDGAQVDLHRSLPRVTVDNATCWATLAERRQSLSVAGVTMDGLDAVGRLLHVALHAAEDGPRRSKTMSDLDRALTLEPSARWNAVALLASRLGATNALREGLRLHPAGRRIVADVLQTTVDTDSMTSLRATGPPPLTLGFESLAQLSRSRDRLRFLARKTVPTHAHMRHWYPLARRGPVGLGAAHIMRWAWLARAAPAGYRAWRRFREKSEPDA